MIRRTTKLTLELLGGLIAGLAVLGALAAWRLSTGPVSLDFLKPHIERALSSEGGEIKVTIASAELAWRSTDHTLVVRALEMRAHDALDRQIASVPVLAVRLSGLAMLRGLLAPTEIELVGPSARLVRTESGRLELALTADLDSPPEQDQGALAALLVGELLAPPRPERALSYLKRVSLRGGSLALDDRMAKRVWRAPRADIRLTRDDAGVRASMAVTLDLAGRRPSFEGDLLYRPGADSIDVTLAIADLEPAWIGSETPVLAAFDRVRLPVSGIASLRLNSALQLQAVRFELAGTAGTLALPELYEEPLSVARMEARGIADIAAGRLEVERLFLDLGGPTVTVDGMVTGMTGSALGMPGRMNALAVLRDVPLERLPQLWPAALAVEARNWIVPNILGGRVPEARAAIVLRLPTSDNPKPFVESVTGNLSYEGLSVHYFRPLPPVTGVNGTATFTRERFDLAVRHGGLKQLRVEHATIGITGLDVKDQNLTSEIVVSGPIRDALEVLDTQPLRFARRFNMTPSEVGGRAAARLVFELQLEKKLTKEDVKVAAAANLRDVSQTRGMFGLAISEGMLALKLDGRGMSLDGGLKLNGHPAQVEWRENFTDGAPFRRRFRVTGAADERMRASVGVDLAEFLSGPIGAELSYTEMNGGRADLAASLDLRPAGLRADFAGWSKAPGTAGTAKFSAQLVRGTPVTVSDLTVTTEGLEVRGRVEFTNGAFHEASLTRLKIGETDLTGKIEAMPPRGYSLRLSGTRLDARPFLRDDTPSRGGMPIRVSGRFDRVIIEGGQSIDQTTIDLDYDGNRPRLVLIDGKLGERGRLLIEQQQKGSAQNLTITSDAAGELLRRLDITDRVVGGKLRVAGTIEDTKPGRPTTANVEIHDFRAVNTPGLVRLLTVASLTGIRELAAGEGITFTKLSAQIKRTGKIVEFSDALAFGPALGIRVTGKVDQAAETIAVHGTVIPAYSFNEVVGKIPVLGMIFTGGKGIFAANFNASGPADDPNVTVNPLSSLAPGFLGAFLDRLFNPDPNQVGTGLSEYPLPAPER